MEDIEIICDKMKTIKNQVVISLKTIYNQLNSINLNINKNVSSNSSNNNT